MKVVISKGSGFTLTSNIIKKYFKLSGLGKPYFYNRIYGNSINSDLDDVKYTKNTKSIYQYFYISLNDLGPELKSDNLLFSDENYFSYNDIDRTDINLIKAVEEHPSTELKIVEIPDDVEWYIYESEDGLETIHEKHRVWF